MDRILKYPFSVRVWGESFDIEVHQKSKSVWIARGEFQGQPLETKGSSASSAAKHWQDGAQYRGNDGPAASSGS